MQRAGFDLRPTGYELARDAKSLGAQGLDCGPFPGQHSPEAAPDIETGRTAGGELLRSAAHIHNTGAAKWGRYRAVSGILDHFSAGFTLDTYAHVTATAQKAAANTMSRVPSGTV